MKNALTILLLAIASAAFTQPVSSGEIPGQYQISKMYISDTLFYDIANPAKSNKNILIEISKQVPSNFYNQHHNFEPIAYDNDSTIAISLFYKDIKKALSTTITFEPGGSLVSTAYIYKTGKHLAYPFSPALEGVESTEHWDFNEAKQIITISHKGSPKEKYPVAHINNLVVITIEDKVEHTKIELQKMY